jgi:ribosomal protein S14
MKKNYNIKVLNNLVASKDKEVIVFFKKLLENNFSLPLGLKLAVLFSPSFNLKIFFSSTSFNRFKSQCLLTWRSRSVYSFFWLSRIALRELSSFGCMKGIKKSSW